MEREQALTVLEDAVADRQAAGQAEARALAEAMAEVCPTLFKPKLRPNSQRHAMGVAFLLTLFVVVEVGWAHRFQEVFASVGVALPAATLLFCKLSSWMRAAWPVTLLSLIAVYLYAAVPRWHIDASRGRRFALAAIALALAALIALVVVAMFTPLISLLTGLTQRRGQ